MKSRVIKFIYILIILHLMMLLLVYLWNFAQIGWKDQIGKNPTRLKMVLSNFVVQRALPGEIFNQKWGKFTNTLHKSYSTSTRLLPSANTFFTIKTGIDQAKTKVTRVVVSVYSWTRIFNFASTRLKAALANFKQLAVVKTTKFLGNSLGSFYAQLVFGKLPELKPALHPLFNLTGMQYVLVVSGFHLSLLARTVASSLHNLLTKKQVAIVVIGVVVVYFFTIGFSASLFRAVWMLIAAVTARFLLLRQHQTSHFFLWFLLLISLLYPSILGSVSFQLSVVATAGIIYLMPLFTGQDNIIAALERGEITGGNLSGSLGQKYLSLVKSSGLVSFSVNLALFPLLLYYFGEVHLISLVISSFFFWLAPLLIASAWLIVVAVFVASGPILWSIKLIAIWLVALVEKILQTFAARPLTISVNNLPLTTVIGWWLFLLIGVWLHSRISNRSQQYHRLVI